MPDTSAAGPPQELFLATQGFLLLWFAAMGACIGSFLNVVIHRLPAGLSIVHPGSRCPNCGHGIDARDNIPVFSWILLRGKCRNCQAPISVRYPLIEAGTAALFVVLGTFEVLWRAWNVPYVNAANTALFEDIRPWVIFGYHLFLFNTLVCTAVICHDRQRVPVRLQWPALVVGIATPWFLHEARPVGFAGIPDCTGMPILFSSLIGMLAGLIADTGFCFISKSLKRFSEYRLGILPIHFLVGIFLGWQAVIVVAGATLVICCIALLLKNPRFFRWPDVFTVSSTICTLLFVLTWRWVLF